MSGEFVHRLKNGDDDAWTELRERLLRFARVRVARASSSLDAEDIVNEALVRVKTNLKSFQGRSRLTTWACGICLNVVREMERSGAREVAADVEAMLEVSAGRPESNNPLQTLLTDELIAVVRACQKEASDADRELLNMAYWKGLPFAKIAERLGMTEGAVKTAMFRARQHIAACVARKLRYEDLLPRSDG